MQMNRAPCATNGHHKPQVLLQGPAQLPEAACSVNLRFDVPGYADRAQATGRGASPAEAAAHLRETIDATRLALAPPAPPMREEQLAHLLASGLAKATAQADYGLVERLAKAAALVLSGAVEATDSPAVMAVRSQTAADHWYEVTLSGFVCTCKDWSHAAQAGHMRPCKHGLAVAFSTRLPQTTP